MAGYSPTPLAKKLGFRDGCRAQLVNHPSHYEDLIHPLPPATELSCRFRKDVDICHFFTKSKRELRQTLPKLMQIIRRNGAIWVSWPKRSSGVVTDITEDTIRDVALPLGLVDIKVCAIDDTWSGLKLVIRKELR
jgi:hypothetical protein